MAGVQTRFVRLFKENDYRLKEAFMRKCLSCHEEFADKFNFCPVDGTPLNQLAVVAVAPPAPTRAAGHRRGISSAPNYLSSPNSSEEGLKSDQELSRILHSYVVPATRQELDRHILASYRKEKNSLELERKKEEIIMRRWITFSLVFVFVISVLATLTVIILDGRGVLNVRITVMSALISATVVQGVALYKRVIKALFPDLSAELAESTGRRRRAVANRKEQLATGPKKPRQVKSKNTSQGTVMLPSRFSEA